MSSSSSSRLEGYPSIESGSLGSGSLFHPDIDWSVPPYCDAFIHEKLDGSNLTLRVEEEDDGKRTPTFYNGKKLIREVKEGATYAPTVRVLSATSIVQKAHTGWDYCGESQPRLKTNIVQYERLPPLFFSVFDIRDENGTHLSATECATECDRMGFFWIVPKWVSKGEAPGLVIPRLLGEIESGVWVSILGGTPEGFLFKCH